MPLTSRQLGLLREGEKFSGAASSSLPSSSCVIRLATGRAALRAAALTAEATGHEEGVGLEACLEGCVRGAVRGSREQAGQEQPVGLSHSQVFRLGKQGAQTSPLAGSAKGTFLPCGCIFLTI